MSIRRIFQFSLAGMLLCAGSYSCKSKELSMRMDFPGSVTVEKLMERDKERRNTFNGVWIKRFTGNVSNGMDEITISGSIKLIRDSVILITVNGKLNIEALRILFTADSFGIIDRINRQFFEGDYGFLERRIQARFTFQDIQALLLNEFMVYGEDNRRMERDMIGRARLVNQKYVLEFMINTTRENERLKQRMEFDADGLNITKIEVLEPDMGKRILIDYDETYKQENISFYETISVQLFRGDQSGSCKITMERITFTTDFTIAFQPGKDYERIWR